MTWTVTFNQRHHGEDVQLLGDVGDAHLTWVEDDGLGNELWRFTVSEPLRPDVSDAERDAFIARAIAGLGAERVARTASATLVTNLRGALTDQGQPVT